MEETRQKVVTENDLRFEIDKNEDQLEDLFKELQKGAIDKDIYQCSKIVGKIKDRINRLDLLRKLVDEAI